MHPLVQVLTCFLLAVTMGLSLAHALEYPGKRRLDEAAYRATQTIYYPGFTLGGLFGELGGMIAVGAILVWGTLDDTPFWAVSAAFVFQLLAHATYWILTHPVNSVWMKYSALPTVNRSFFGSAANPSGDWRRMRDIWEMSHIIRAAFHAIAFIAFVVALIS